LKNLILSAFFGIWCSVSGLAHGADEDSSEDKPGASERESGAAERTASAKPATVGDSFGHRGQFGLRAGLVGGYNMIFRYDQSPFCAPPEASKEPQKVCGHAAPVAFDLAASYALLDFVEPYAFMRLGLASETQTHTTPVKIIGVGARIYTMSDSAFKIFVDPAFGWELEGGTNDAALYNPKAVYKKDLLIHLAAGPQFDFSRYAGVFADAGLSTGVLRAIHTELELQLGVQARLP
jgi:hypothetical protein